MIRFEHVKKRLGNRVVLDDVSFEIQKNETFVIVGSSGAGKSVSLRHMIRLLTPDEGRVWIGDDVVSEATGKDLEKIRSRFGVLFQSAALLQWLSVADNVGLPLQEKARMTRAAIHTKVEETLKMVNLEEAHDKLPANISGGMQKRVGLARAIIMEPEIILYDEPTSGLDPVTSRTIDQLIDRLRRGLGVTSVVVTHDLHSALAIGTRIAMLHRGRMIEVSSPSEFIRSKHKEVQNFLASQYITKDGEWEVEKGESKVWRSKV
ncbi:MAG: ATP-binding cassette domain-containing protein [Kiritimatiellae bacterium]|nr:ATP-binding cassette domain-containing protein [Kiritimatiellia bacterium]